MTVQPGRTIILASSSPYRKSLMERLHLPFETVSPNVDETPHPDEHAADLAKRLARLKAQVGGARRSDALVIGCDQCAVLDHELLGKPGGFDNAFEQLKRTSGRSVDFHTGLCLLNTANGETQVDRVTVRVKFRTLTETQITAYLRKETPYHCAGSFMSEGLGIALIQRIDGEDPTALIGLPLIRLVSMLARAGVHVI